MVHYADKMQEAEAPPVREQKLRDKTAATRKRGPMDTPFFLLTVLILTIGVIMVLSASFARAFYSGKSPTYYFMRQLGFAVAGVIIMVVASLFTMNFYQKISPLILAVSFVMLLLVPFLGTGKSEVGANRWFDLGFTTFQPSEIAKFAVVLAFATLICRFGNRMGTFKYGVLPFAAVLGMIVALLVMEPHYSCIVIILALGAIMMFAGGTRWQYFVFGALVVALGAWVAVTQVGYVADRVNTWLDPFKDPRGDGFQTIQSLYAIGSGGLLGLGLGQGRQKYLYLPEEHNDFIFSVVCEELGLVGAFLILTLFALLVVRGYWLALHARDKFSSLTVIGITSLLAIQVILNVAVVTNLVPCTGISLPFFSYGGTALLIQMAEMGVVLSVSRDIPLRKQEK